MIQELAWVSNQVEFSKEKTSKIEIDVKDILTAVDTQFEYKIMS